MGSSIVRSLVATKIASSRRARFNRSNNSPRTVRPANGRSDLPGKRDEPILAWTTAIVAAVMSWSASSEIDCTRLNLYERTGVSALQSRADTEIRPCDKFNT